MRNIMMIALAGAFAVITAQTPLFAGQSLDGLWARTLKDCNTEDDGPNSLTTIDLENTFHKKGPPLVDQYENHCRIDRKTMVGTGMELGATCFEFWEDYNKGVNGRKAAIKMVPGPNNTLKIDGKPYRRCKVTIEDGKKG
jgi:hypothetical protein